MRFTCLFLTAAIIFSCNEASEVASYRVITPDSIEERSSNLIELVGENFGPRSQFGYLLDLALVNGSIIVQDKKKDHAFFMLKGDDDPIPFQEIGDGPKQVDKSDFLKIVDFNESSNELSFFDYYDKSLNKIKVKGSSTFQRVCSIPESYWGQMQSAVCLNDSLVAVTGRFPKTKFKVFKKGSSEEVYDSEYANSFENELSEESRVAVAPVDIGVNAKNGLIFVTKPGVNSIDIYSVDGKVNRMYSFANFENISEEGLFNPGYFYYYKVKTQEDVVYGLYLGVSRESIAMQELFLSETRPELHVFNLLTDELLRFKLDRVVNACIFDAVNNVVYCIEEDNEDQPLVRYEIPEIL